MSSTRTTDYTHFSSGIEHEILQKSDGIIEGMLLLLLFSRMLRLIYA